MELPIWYIFYDDEREVTSLDCSPKDAPLDGVQAILEFHYNGTSTVHHDEYYWWTGDRWASGGVNSLERWLRKIAPQVKYGRWTSTKLFERIGGIVSDRQHGKR